MAQSLFTSQVPTSQDLTDGIVLMLGTYVVPAVAGTVTHIRFRFPETVQGDVKAALFETAGSTKVSGADQIFPAPTLDDWNEVALAAPVSVAAGIEYCAAVRITRYCSSIGLFPLTNGDLSAPTDAGRYSTFDPDGSVTFPNNASPLGAAYFVDVVFAAEEPAEGSAALGLGLVVAAAGARASRAEASLGVDLAVVAAGARPAHGAAALGLDLVVAAAGIRPSGGAAALGLSLAVAARGSNGDAGRPVATYPWTPRPVRSFSEVVEP